MVKAYFENLEKKRKQLIETITKMKELQEEYMP